MIDGTSPKWALIMERLRVTVQYETKKLLHELTSKFYRTTAKSFSETRSAPWHGWPRVVDGLQERILAGCMTEPLRVLDVGCGNLRFEKYLVQRGIDFRAICVDNCKALMNEALDEVKPWVQLRDVDVMSKLLDGSGLDFGVLSNFESFDLICAFGFLHHVPSQESRDFLLRELGQMLAPRGLLVVSFWQFARDPKISAKAQKVTEDAKRLYDLADLESGDYLLGWQQDESVFRYCHSFTDEEFSALSASLSPDLREVERFSADGRSGDLNRYVIWEKI